MIFRKKPILVEAIQFVEIHSIARMIREWPEFEGVCSHDPRMAQLIIRTLEGEMRADVGDWIIKGVAGEFYPIKNSIFRETYDTEFGKKGGDRGD